MSPKRFRSTVAHLVRKQSGMTLADIDADADVGVFHDSYAAEDEQVLQAVAAADSVLSENGFIDPDPALTAGIVALVMDQLVH